MESTRPYTARSDVERQPGKTILQERDVRMFQALNRHGPLSVPYLFAFGGKEDSTLNALSKRLALLSRKGTRRLVRAGQLYHKIGMNDFELYANSKDIDHYLINQGIAHRLSISLSKFNVHHEAFLAHCTASIELGVREHDITFVEEHEHLKTAPTRSRLIPSELVIDGKVSHKNLVPDAYFGLTANDKWLSFCVEADCATEILESDNPDIKAWSNTFRKYIRTIERDFHKQHFGIQGNLRVLIITTRRLYLDHMMAVLEKLTDHKSKRHLRQYFCFKVWPEFDSEFFAPREVNYGMVENEWLRVNYDPFYLV